MVNIIGVQGKYFLTDRWDINLMFSMNIGVTPKKDYIEGDRTVQDMQIPAKQYLEGKNQEQLVDQYWIKLLFQYKETNVSICT